MSKKSLQNPNTKIMTLVLVCFFLSGMTGLIYQILWTRMIVKIIGGAPFAVSIILTVFMAGLGLGSYIASRRIDNITEPLKLVRVYGILELVIGGYCFVLPVLLKMFQPFYAVMYNRIFGHFMLYSVLTFIGCALLLLVPVICMGATLPILCRFYVTRLSHLGTHAGRLYGLNTIGAAFGALLCGFWFIRFFGMFGTLVFAVVLNGIIGFICIAASYRIKPQALKDEQAAPQTDDPEKPGQPVWKNAATAALIIFAVSGFCSMAYEVIWTKLLGLIIGPTTYSFTIVLVTFITSLALGSMIFGRLGDKTKSPIRLLIYTQLAAAIFALAVSQLLGNSQFFFAKLIYQFQDNFALLNVLKTVILFCFMVLPALCLGATFPLVGKICTPTLAKVGRSIGFAYAINTIGAVLGSFCAGFLLVPLIGKENGLRLVVIIQMATSLFITAWLLWTNKHRKLEWIPAGVIALLGLVLCLQFPSWNRTSLVVAKYHRPGVAETDYINKAGWLKILWQGSDASARYAAGKVVYYGDGIGGFTSVLQRDDMFGNSNFSLLISGKADASSDADMPTQTLSAHFPMIFHPNPKSIMVLGYASGVTAGEVLHYPIDRLDVLEISREVVKASEFFEPWNNNALSNPKTELIIQDGRAHLQLINRKYDVIISEPSNPWMAGLAALFTRDFFAAAKDRLNDEGIFVQFIHSYQMDWLSFAMVCRTFADVYPVNTLIQTEHGDYLMMGFVGINGLVLSNAQRNFSFAQQSENITLLNPEVLYRLVITEDLKFMAGSGPINSDMWPRLEFDAPKALYEKNEDTIKTKMNSGVRMRPQTAEIVRKVTTDVDAQIDLAVMTFSLNQDFYDLVDLSLATQAQKDRYFGLIEEYCATHTIDYSLLPDEELKQRCRLIQIKAIEENLDILSGNTEITAYYTLGDLYRESRQLLKAEACYSKALELKPTHAELHNDLAVVLHYQGKLAKAIAHYNEALRLKPSYPEAHSNRQKALNQLRK